MDRSIEAAPVIPTAEIIGTPLSKPIPIISIATLIASFLLNILATSSVELFSTILPFSFSIIFTNILIKLDG